MSDKIFIGLGSNLGNRENNLSEALKLLETNHLEVNLASSIVETLPWGLTHQPTFLNQVIMASWPGDAFSLLSLLLFTEQKLGRIREKKWGPRIIDLDLLDFKGEIQSSENLQLPHPHISERAFVLEPWAEIAPNHTIPGSDLTILEMLAVLREQDPH